MLPRREKIARTAAISRRGSGAHVSLTTPDSGSADGSDPGDEKENEFLANLNRKDFGVERNDYEDDVFMGEFVR